MRDNHMTQGEQNEKGIFISIVGGFRGKRSMG